MAQTLQLISYIEDTGSQKMNRVIPTMLTNINKILVVDKEAELAHAIQLHLSRIGFLINSEVTLAKAQKTISQAAQENALFDLVITDISMPGNSGIELLLWIQENYPLISIILISSFGTDDLIAENIRPLLDSFCKKPFSPKTLLNKIHIINQGRKNNINNKKVSLACSENILTLIKESKNW